MTDPKAATVASDPAAENASVARDSAYSHPFAAIVVDRYGSVMPEWALDEHLEDDHDECEDCPDYVRVVTGEAMPSEPDNDGLNGQFPNPVLCEDIWVEHEVASREGYEIKTAIEQAQQIAAALNAAAGRDR